MQLNSVKGLKPKTIAALQRARVRNAEDLALIDVRKTKVRGVSEKQLRTHRKAAQRAIFHFAAARVREIARSTRKTITQDVHALEGVVRDATVGLMIAARAAEERALEAVRATEQSTYAFARLAADRARIATRSAEKEYRKILRAVERAPKPTRTRLRRYVVRAESAKRLADGAHKRASAAVKWAQTTTRAAQLRARSTSLFDRVQRSLTKTAPTRRA